LSTTRFAAPVTCNECPWLRSARPGRFPPERYAALEPTCRGGGLPSIFACHKSPEGEEFACAGFLLVCGWENNRVRMAAIQGRYDPREVRATGPLFGSFDEMARSNGYDPGGDNGN
jgi:Family of unknown function (DUF6283)